jgi:hypothetical protein
MLLIEDKFTQNQARLEDLKRLGVINLGTQEPDS